MIKFLTKFKMFGEYFVEDYKKIHDKIRNIWDI